MTSKDKESCYNESRNVANNIVRIIGLSIDQTKGIQNEEQLDSEIDELTENQLRFKQCILKDIGFRKAHETELKRMR